MRLVTWLVLVNTSRLLMLPRSLLRAQRSTAAPGALPKRCSVFIHVHDVCRQVMDAQQVKTCDNTVLCIVLFMILMIAVFWQTRGMKVLRAEFTRGFHEDLEFRTPAEVKLERLMRVHRIDTLFQWIFAKLALPLLTLCLLPLTSNLTQQPDTGLPAVLDALQHLQSSTSPETLQADTLAHYILLWEVRKLFIPFTIWLGLVYLAVCSGPRWNAALPVGIAIACKALAKLQPHFDSAQADALQLEAISSSLGLIVISFLLYQGFGLLKLFARVFNIPRRLSHSSLQPAAARSMAGAYDRHRQATGKQRRQAKQAGKLLALLW